MREVRRALIEADVSLDVVKDFVEKVKAKAIGQDVVRSVTPGQMVVKVVHDELVAMLGSDAAPIDIAAAPAPRASKAARILLLDFIAFSPVLGD